MKSIVYYSSHRAHRARQSCTDSGPFSTVLTSILPALPIFYRTLARSINLQVVFSIYRSRTLKFHKYSLAGPNPPRRHLSIDHFLLLSTCPDPSRSRTCLLSHPKSIWLILSSECFFAVSGLNYTSHTFTLLGKILVRIRGDKRSPPTGPFATAHLEEIQSLHSRIMATLTHAPEPLHPKEIEGEERAMDTCVFRHCGDVRSRTSSTTPRVTRKCTESVSGDAGKPRL